MKKSLVIISISILSLAVLLTSCGKSDILTDFSGNTHAIVTQKGGEPQQDAFGNLYEQVTDSKGNTVTQVYGFPEVSTNKSNSKIENGVLSVEVPKKWETSEITTSIRLRHSGECVKLGESPCQIDFASNSNKTLQQTYDANMSLIEGVAKYNSNVTNITEYNTKICSIDAKAVSYHVDDVDTTVFYYCLTKGETNIEITANVCDKCYDKTSIEELLNSCITLKELPTLSTQPTTAEPTSDETTSAAASTTSAAQ